MAPQSPCRSSHAAIRKAIEHKAAPRNLARAIRARIEPLGGVDLELPPREPMREPPDFDRRSGGVARDDRRGLEP